MSHVVAMTVHLFFNNFLNAISIMMFLSPFPGGTVVAFEIGPTIDILRYTSYSVFVSPHQKVISLFLIL